MFKEDIIRGIHLVEKLIHFTTLCPEKENWNYTALKDNAPRILRLKQIDVLIGAFGLRTGEKKYSLQQEIDYILNGEFYVILGLKISKALEDYVHRFLMKPGRFTTDILNPICSRDVGIAFSSIIAYKRLLSNLLSFNSGVGECSPSMNLAYYQIKMVDEINKNIYGQFDQLDETIELIINPYNKFFTESEFVEKYGYVSDSEVLDADIDYW